MEGHGAVMTGPDGDLFLPQQRRQIVGVNSIDRKGNKRTPLLGTKNPQAGNA